MTKSKKPAHTFVEYDRYDRILVRRELKIEAAARRYQKVRKAQVLFHRDYWCPAFEAVVRVKQAHAKPSHKHTCAGGGTGPCKCWWLYKGRTDEYHGGLMGFDWVEEPKHFKNLKIGQKFYDLDQRMNTLLSRKCKFAAVLDGMICKALYQKLPHPNSSGPKTLRVWINGETYWYHTEHMHAGGLIWKRLAWPEDELDEITL